MKNKLLAIFLLAASSMFARTHFSISVGLGGYGGYGYYRPAPVVAYVPPCPGPGYYWTNGYWVRTGPRYYWRTGYWRPRRVVVRRYYYPRRVVYRTYWR